MDLLVGILDLNEVLDIPEPQCERVSVKHFQRVTVFFNYKVQAKLDSPMVSQSASE